MLLLAFALLARTTNIDGIANDFRAAHLGISVSLGFALAAMLAVALTEAGRIPTDNPSGHLELAMVHEAMALDYSGRLLALLDYAGVLRLLAWMNLIGTIFLPFGMARAGDVLSWPLGLVLWALKLAVMAVALCLFEVSRAKMRVFRVPEFLGRRCCSACWPACSCLSRRGSAHEPHFFPRASDGRDHPALRLPAALPAPARGDDHALSERGTGTVRRRPLAGVRPA
ncbi:NADH-quinone oxidoreductase subunit H [Acidocella sp. MX-AZ03]|nr:NADH-quinone oxidoreductase subunit H [Acidocella sp. MX-AZ03]WBO58864.1 NADH-quinone oxidoreductase subunit H [Acidocella sp. MX-AZ03]